MTLKPLHAALLLAATVFLGGVLGWWIMGGALASASRVELIAAIQSLPPVGKLPALSPSALQLDDDFVSPGGPVWISLAPITGGAGKGTVCRFDRKTGGGVTRPSCQSVPELERGARFAAGGNAPTLLLPTSPSSREVRAIVALSGKELQPVSNDGLFSVPVAKGTRLVRQFRSAPAKLEKHGPTEGAFIGPHTAHAIIEPPRAGASDDARVFLCATPTGYVRAIWQAPRLRVEFSANTEESRVVSTRVPSLDGLAPRFACGTHLGSFTWLAAGGKVARVRCDPDECRHESVALGDIPTDRVAIVQEVGQHTVLVYDREGVPMLRLGNFDELGHSPSGPLFAKRDGETPPRAKDLRFIATGTSLLIFAPLPTPRVAQVYEDGTLEPLAPR